MEVNLLLNNQNSNIVSFLYGSDSLKRSFQINIFQVENAGNGRLHDAIEKPHSLH